MWASVMMLSMLHTAVLPGLRGNVTRAGLGWAGLRCAGKKFPLEQAAEALQESVRDARGGKVFLEG